MKKSPDKNDIEDISLEFGIDPSFIEKDWYAVQLLVLISELQGSKDIGMVFSGGTSLSKGYSLIKRFSEDLDFILTQPEGVSLSQGQRKAFRKDIVSAIQSDERFSIDETNIKKGDGHRFFKIPIQYERGFEASFLRPYLQLEMTFMDLKRPVEKRNIHSIISGISNEQAELEIDCVSAIETAGDKLSALTWRVLVRERSDEKDDPTLIRHLHDLAALEGVIASAEDDFVSSAHESLQRDQNRRGGDVIEKMPIAERLIKALEVLREDGGYQKEYKQFVENMSYAAQDELIHFEAAIQALERIIAIYLKESP